ncbi:mitochondrial import inner membrane translocase subunit TIM44 [Planococcus citri]|uniref:mitochondrial import inner membrane translocase subunit TIM44 n=1 Tax=Planococcus citri TaxID=170843 RepID=UPI0031F8279C
MFRISANLIDIQISRRLSSVRISNPVLSQTWNRRIDQCNAYSSQPQKQSGFIGKFFDNIKQEFAKNKEMKENLKKFREEAHKLEHSDALKKARQKYETVESEASRSTEVLKERLGSIKHKVHDVIEEASKSDLAKKAEQLKQEISKTAGKAAESISESGSKIGKTSAFRTISQTAEAVKKEIDDSSFAGNVYQPPTKLRKRVDATIDSANIAPNEEATGVELHKDSKFYQSWQNFKNNNTTINKILDWKIQYDESDNPVVRASRFVTDKVTDIVGGLFQKTELSEVLTEICKLDPNFDKEEFLKLCERDIIPNVLEAIVRGDLEILKDWCHEAPYNVISAPLKEAIEKHLIFNSKVLDIDKTDLVMGKIMDQGPVLIISFQAQQIICMKDKNGTVVEGDPEKILRVSYVWALCRDTSELNPRAAWKLLDMSANVNEQLL